MDLAGGAYIFLAFLLILIPAVAYSYYSRRGSAINQRNYGNVYSDAPGARVPSTLGSDRVAAQRLTHGTR